MRDAIPKWNWRTAFILKRFKRRIGEAHHRLVPLQ